ncbi:unnamed protein product [Spirodela intermedia]|uniref:RING-type domain-containing protein n=1 Tax=Spirodela intermedia TaxID=51605 RepID=A0A7I8IK00_SPIIN|nr:unnamed protein product [Spirodela intermedia]CAA6658208.1 unnamed protein product [Spirodela intermedia]
MQGSPSRNAAAHHGFGIGSCCRASKRLAFAGLICIFAPGGAIVGAITGAIKGQTTETGLLRGAAIGAVAGAVVSMELLEASFEGDPSSKVSLLASLVSGKAFRELVSPAMLKAYQWQGISSEAMGMLPKFKLHSLSASQFGERPCAICLQEFVDGQGARRLPSCGHLYHMACVDRWLVRNSSCPICRQDVCVISL